MTTILRRAAALCLLAACAGPALAEPAPASSAATAGRHLSSDSLMGELLDNPAALAILRAELPVIANSPQISAARGISLRQLAQYQPSMVTAAKLAAIDAALARAPSAVSSGKVSAPPPPMDPRVALMPATIRLWDGPAPLARGSKPEDVPTLTVFTPAEAVNAGAAVIVAPGGGYRILATGLEGRQVADWFAARGITAFVLSYRLVSNGYAHPAQLVDAQRAVRWVRTHAAEYGIDPARIGMIGFSAGGHLTAMAETQFDPGNAAAADPVERASSRPDFAVLGYPAIRISDRMANFGLVSDTTPKASLGQLDPSAHVRADSPPTFLWATTTDATVPATDSTVMYNALAAARVPAELHIFGHGRHGMGLGMADPAIGLWTAALHNWLIDSGIIASKGPAAN